MSRMTPRKWDAFGHPIPPRPRLLTQANGVRYGGRLLVGCTPLLLGCERSLIRLLTVLQKPQQRRVGLTTLISFCKRYRRQVIKTDYRLERHAVVVRSRVVRLRWFVGRSFKRPANMLP